MYRVGVIGCRGIGNRHAQGADGLANAEVVAGCDLVEEQRRSFEEEFRPTNPGLEMYGDYREMLDKAKPDIVTIARLEMLFDQQLFGIEHRPRYQDRFRDLKGGDTTDDPSCNE